MSGDSLVRYESSRSSAAIASWVNGETNIAQTYAALDQMIAADGRRDQALEQARAVGSASDMSPVEALTRLYEAHEYAEQAEYVASGPPEQYWRDGDRWVEVDTYTPENVEIRTWPGEKEDAEATRAGDDLDRQLLVTVEVGRRHGLIEAPAPHQAADGGMTTGAPTQQQLRNTREAWEAASAAATTDAQAAGGEGDARQARTSALRASVALNASRGQVSARTAPQQQAAAAVLAARERARAEDAAEDVPTSQQRDDRRDYPTMDQRGISAQRTSQHGVTLQ